MLGPLFFEHMPDWYRKIPTPSTKTRRVWQSMRDTKTDRLRNRRQLKKHQPVHVFWKTYSRIVFLEGQQIKVTSTYHISKLFDVPVSTIVKWVSAGVLPDPFMYQSRGKKQYPVWLASQIRCLVVVVNDLIDDGYVSIPWLHLPEHVEMLHDGYKVALQRFMKRTQISDPIFDTEKADKFGVFILDD